MYNDLGVAIVYLCWCLEVWHKLKDDLIKHLESGAKEAFDPRDWAHEKISSDANHRQAFFLRTLRFTVLRS